MEITKYATCKMCGAQATGDITYCPHCGELLPDMTESVVISKQERDRLSADSRKLMSIYRTGYAPAGKK